MLQCVAEETEDCIELMTYILEQAEIYKTHRTYYQF